MNEKELNNLITKITWCNEVINEYRKENGFNPLDILLGRKDRKDKLFNICIGFLYELEKAVNDFEALRKKHFRKSDDRIKEGRETKTPFFFVVFI